MANTDKSKPIPTATRRRQPRPCPHCGHTKTAKERRTWGEPSAHELMLREMSLKQWRIPLDD